MIRIPRRGAPADLENNQRRWTGRWRENGPSSDWATPRAKTILREALAAITHGKCAYCERNPGTLEIDHYVAKSVDSDSAFVWENLFPACHECNFRKGDVDHVGRLLKPDEDDPEAFFWLGPEGELKPRPECTPPDEQRALKTIEILGLQRPGLRQNREFLMHVVALALPQRSELLLAPEREHKFVIRQTLVRLGRPDLAEQDRRRFEGTPVEGRTRRNRRGQSRR